MLGRVVLVVAGIAAVAGLVAVLQRPHGSGYVHAPVAPAAALPAAKTATMVAAPALHPNPITQVVTPPPPGQPDFVIVSGRMDPVIPNVRSGTTMHFTFEVANQGTADVTGPITVTGIGDRSGYISGLKVGETKSVTVDVPVYWSIGVRWNLQFTVDPENIWKDSNRQNNNSETFGVTIVG